MSHYTKLQTSSNTCRFMYSFDRACKLASIFFVKAENCIILLIITVKSMLCLIAQLRSRGKNCIILLIITVKSNQCFICLIAQLRSRGIDAISTWAHSSGHMNNTNCIHISLHVIIIFKPTSANYYALKCYFICLIASKNT